VTTYLVQLNVLPIIFEKIEMNEFQGEFLMLLSNIMVDSKTVCQEELSLPQLLCYSKNIDDFTSYD
jgi:hypothetical protein